MLVQRMERGGRNNRKGTCYETHFAIYRFLQLTDKWYPQDQEISAILLEMPEFKRVHLSNRLMGAIDDLCVWENAANGQLSYKINYQLKESPNKGKLNKKFIALFDIQTRLDRDVYHSLNFEHVIVCSDQDTVNNNMSGSKLTHPPKSSSFYFPYYDSTDNRILKHDDFRELLSRFCPDQDNYSSAALLLVMPFTSGEYFDLTLSEGWRLILSKEQKEGSRIFSNNLSKNLQPYFVDQCQKVGCSISCNKITYKGLSVIIPENLNILLKDKDVSSLDSPEKIFSLLGFTMP